MMMMMMMMNPNDDNCSSSSSDLKRPSLDGTKKTPHHRLSLEGRNRTELCNNSPASGHDSPDRSVFMPQGTLGKSVFTISSGRTMRTAVVVEVGEEAEVTS